MSDPRPEAPADRLLAGLLLLELAALLALVLCVPVLPIQDAPLHLTVLHALDGIARGDPDCLARFERRPIVPLYAWFYEVARPLVPLLGLQGALRAFLVAHLLAWAACLWAWLGRDPDPGRRWLLLLAPPVVLHGVFYLGFLNMLFVFPLVALGLRCVSPRRALSPRARGGLLSGIGLLTLGLHALGFATWALAIAPAALVAAPPGGRLRALGPLLVPALALLLAAALLLDPSRFGAYAVDWGAVGRGEAGGLPLSWRAPGQMLANALVVLLPAGGPLLPLQLLGVAVALALVALTRRSDPEWARDPERRGCLAGAVAAALAALLLPYGLGEAKNVGLRVVPLVPLLLLGALPPRLGATPRGRAALAGAGGALLLAHAWAFLAWSAEAAAPLGLGRDQPPGRRLLPLTLAVSARTFPRLEHLPLVPVELALLRGWTQPYLWDEAHIPVRLRRAEAAPPLYAPGEVTAAQARAWDLLLLHAPPGDAPAEASRAALLAGPLRGAVLLEEREGWGLYRAPPP